jgi:CMP-N-acetylneuraminate monooxygenase
LRFLRPRSLWEDASVLTLIDDEGIRFSWLNLVDAGSVIDQDFLSNLDLLSSAFDQGASGYPLTWSHLSKQRKVKLLEAQKEKTLELLVRQSNQLRPKYFMPFAGHWRLALPQHQQYAKMIPHTTFNEIKDVFEKDSSFTKFLGIYPGEEFDFFSEVKTLPESMPISFPSGNSDTYKAEEMNNETVGLFLCQMEKLQRMSEAFGVEQVNFTVKSTDGYFKEVFAFGSSLSEGSIAIDLEVSVPSHILRLFAEGEANWDHIAIGYWGEWNRKPDVYPVNFMRLLQSGYSNFGYAALEISHQEISSILECSIGDILESNIDQVPYFLSRLGLPCLSCSRSSSETLGQALTLHNIDQDSHMWILRELTSTIQGQTEDRTLN